nr:MAG TPA: hypothetical protein [Caudoviricetes sp.]
MYRIRYNLTEKTPVGYKNLRGFSMIAFRLGLR